MKIIFYDLDGTLVDTAQDIANAANYMLRELGSPELSREEIARYVGKGLHQLIQACVRSDEKKLIEKGAKIYRSHYQAHMLDHSALYPGAREVLDYFSSVKQVIVTNKPNPYARELLEALGVGGIFSDIIAGDSPFPKKPNPSSIQHILAREAVKPSEALFLGDSLIDIETARNAGLKIVVLTHGFGLADELKSASPDGIFPGLFEFLEYAKEKGWSSK
ncbi:MAG: HAD-IA family hydrolase [Candidatus Omnitrophica bacterium]|nr:HAD-IA family hydrolase [Candidatus Omnitrophota bacterium]